MKTVSLLTYADRLAGSLAGLRRVLAEELPEFNGVHVLPFFTPFDGPDAGFDPSDHRVVDPRLGSWDDIRSIAADGREVTCDFIVNHTSWRAPEFQDWLAHGEASEHDGMYLTFDAVFPEGGREADIASFYRPRPGLPFTPYRRADGVGRLVWTTFQPTQVDIDVFHPAAQHYLDSVMEALRAGGVSTVRLDAVGYAVKTPGTNSFMTDASLAYVADAVAACHALGLEVLVEVHSHVGHQVQLAGIADLVYDFALPPLLLHATYTGDTAPLGRWLAMRPPNSVSVLDTHDGIGVVDALAGRGGEGLLTDEQAEAIIATAAALTGGRSGRASVVPQFNRMPHQINATFAGVLGEDLESLYALRVVQLLLPGPAHVYYLGLLGIGDDEALWLCSGEGRDVNRHHVTPEELRVRLDTPFVRSMRDLVSLVTTHPALAGEFAWEVRPGEVRLGWRNGDHSVDAVVTLGGRRARARLEVTPFG